MVVNMEASDALSVLDDLISKIVTKGLRMFDMGEHQVPRDLLDR